MPTPEPEPEPEPEPSSSPNILLIISDDQGLDASAQYTYSTDTSNTPTLDDLANEGVDFYAGNISNVSDYFYWR
jgi:arylsulfatase A-like enzyme